MSPQVWRQVRRLGALRGPVGDPEDTLARRFGLLAWLVPRRKVLLLTGTSVAGALCEAATLLVVINVASLVAGGDDRTDLAIGPIAVDQVATGQLLLAAASLAITRLVFHLLSSYLAARASADVLGKLRVTLPAAYLHASWPRQAATPSGHLQDLATTHVTESSRAALFSALALTAAVNFLIMVISAVVVSLVAAVVIAIGVGVLYLLFRPLTRVARARARLLAEANTAYATSVDEGARLAFETSSFGIADPFIGRLTRSARLSARRHFQVQLISRSLTGLYQNVALLALVLGLWVISSQDDAELATLGAIVIILLRALSYSQTFQSAQHTLNELLPFAQRARAEIVDYEAHRVEPGDQELASIEALRVEWVSFTYDAAPVLVDLSFDVRPGEAIGIVGPSGSGKSTLAQLLLRLRAPSEGRYLVNGRAAAEYSIPEWSRLVAVVPQEPHLLADTVRENVRFLRDVDDAAIERACRAAHIHDEILSWPEGYDTVLGSGSNPLSGGQRQRLCIARALAGAPDLLVLDEPTSALDMRSESAIQDTLEGLRGTVTLVIIAHRVPTLKLCDRVMVLAGGRVEAFAPPSELAHDNAFFAEALKLSRV